MIKYDNIYISKFLDWILGGGGGGGGGKGAGKGRVM